MLGLVAFFGGVRGVAPPGGNWLSMDKEGWLGEVEAGTEGRGRTTRFVALWDARLGCWSAWLVC